MQYILTTSVVMYVAVGECCYIIVMFFLFNRILIYILLKGEKSYYVRVCLDQVNFNLPPCLEFVVNFVLFDSHFQPVCYSLLLFTSYTLLCVVCIIMCTYVKSVLLIKFILIMRQ